jgi:hypothetical protein
MAAGKCEAALDWELSAWPIQKAMNDLRCSLRVLGAWALASALMGCGAQAGGQTGEEGGKGCRFALTPLSFEETSPLGFSAADVLAFSEGEQRAPLRWLASDVPYGPEQGPSEITARVAPQGKAEFAEPAPQQGELLCTEAVRIPVTLELSTAGGALSERVETRLEAASARQAQIVALLDSNEIRGDFAFDSVTLGERRFVRLEIALYFESGTFSGFMQGGIQDGSTGDGGVTSFRSVPLACWGDEQGPNQTACSM